MDPELTLDLQIASDAELLPSADQMRLWAKTALDGLEGPTELCIRIVDGDESKTLNQQYRGKNKPTNVLSFPADIPEELGLPMLGDVVICAPLVSLEAAEQNKTLDAHWAHLLIHGILHLRGYDHIDDADAEKMESLETQLMTRLNFPAPYEPTGALSHHE